MKALIWLGTFIGSVLGGYLPLLWGGSLFSFTSILFSGAGGIIGVIVGYKLAQYFGL